MSHHYYAYGLRFRSDLALPFRAATKGPCDVDIRATESIPAMAMATRFRNWQAEPGTFRIEVKGSGIALVEGGARIRYLRESGAEARDVVSLVIGSALAALLMQRDIVPLHSCAVATETGALLVVGQSGAGKSTLLGGLMQHGLPMLADDVTGLDLNERGEAEAIPGFPAARLWRDSLALLGRDEAGLEPVRRDIAKFYLDTPSFRSEAMPIRGIAWLSPGNRDELAIDRLTGAQSIRALGSYVFRKNFLHGLEKQAMAFRTVSCAVASRPMIRMWRPAGPMPPYDMAGRLLEEL